MTMSLVGNLLQGNLSRRGPRIGLLSSIFEDITDDCSW